MSTTRTSRYSVSPATLGRVWAAVTRTPQASVTELADELGMGVGHVSDALTMLGYVEYEPRSCRARTIVVPLHTSGFRIVAKADS